MIKMSGNTICAVSILFACVFPLVCVITENIQIKLQIKNTIYHSWSGVPSDSGIQIMTADNFTETAESSNSEKLRCKKLFDIKNEHNLDNKDINNKHKLKKYPN